VRGLATADDLVPDLEGASAQEVLEHLVEHFHPRLYVACSFQKEASVIMDLLVRIEPNARFFTLDTGVLFEETYDTWRQLEERYGIKVEVFGDTAYSVAVNFTEAKVFVPEDSVEQAREVLKERPSPP